MTNSGLAEINGAQIYYWTSGQGPPLLLIHAGVADSRMWEPQIEPFSKHFHVIRFDLRGFGRSNMPAGSFCNYEDVRALLDHLQIVAAYVLGISFGGAIALDFTLAYPDRVKALILGAPSVGGAQPSERIKRFWEEEEAALDRGDLDEATELNLRLWVDGPHRPPEQVNPEVRERVRQMQLAIFQKEVPDNIGAIDLVPPAIERLSEIDVPVLVLVGDLDLTQKQALARQVAADISQANLIVLPGVAHMLNMEQPEPFNQAVLAFLASQGAT